MPQERRFLAFIWKNPHAIFPGPRPYEASVSSNHMRPALHCPNPRGRPTPALSLGTSVAECVVERTSPHAGGAGSTERIPAMQRQDIVVDAYSFFGLLRSDGATRFDFRRLCSLGDVAYRFAQPKEVAGPIGELSCLICRAERFWGKHLFAPYGSRRYRSATVRRWIGCPTEPEIHDFTRGLMSALTGLRKLRHFKPPTNRTFGGIMARSARLTCQPLRQIIGLI